ncbi:MAG: 2,3-bisphosphoglycerate-independent phosphoglycerate mutase, partial [Proteobacteria bacterium]|nr:2,3-bisphosphoglycerate-independent phosphoglycerate mutase [Pseudomonadota bacterium]
YDEFIKPTVRVDENGRPAGLIKDGDAVIFFNFRADRARELTWALNQPDFKEFDVHDRPKLGYYVCMTEYDQHLNVPVAFPPNALEDTLSDVVSRAGKSQLHIAETEKYAHVTFFFNGGVEDPVPGEDRVLIPSPKEVNTYDQKPAMSAVEVTDEVLGRIAADRYDLIVMNYANGDMVGHTGVMAAAVQAMETLDRCLARVVPAVLGAGGLVVLTADHGNAEQMIDPDTGGPYTAHTVSNPVPLILIDPQRSKENLRSGGALRDVAPTVLALMGLSQPAAMTGKSLIEPGG